MKNFKTTLLVVDEGMYENKQEADKAAEELLLDMEDVYDFTVTIQSVEEV